MSLPPITIPDLATAGTVDPTNDLLLIRQGLTDRKITPQNLITFQFGSQTIPLPNAIQASDFFLVGRPISGGGYTNYRAESKDVTFPNGTAMWFNSATPPSGWRMDNTYADTVLGVIGGAQAYQTVGLQGTWQQADHTLTVAEMPSHSHNLYMSPKGGIWDRSANWGNSANQAYSNGPIQATGGSLPHNHGSVWRPRAAVGCIGIKDFTQP